MNLRELEYIVAIAEHGQFGRAAEACHVSQSTLSIQVKKLEEFLGVAIFERDNRHVLVTAVGEQILERARAALREAREIRRVAAAARDPDAGDFTLGVFPTLAPYYLPAVVPALTAAFPRLRLLLVEEKTPVLLAMLTAGNLDAAVLALPAGGDAIETTALFDDEFLLAVPAGHPLARTKRLREKDLIREELLLLEDGHCLRDQALAVCERSGAGERRDFRATSLETLRHMVASGSGITLIPRIAVREDAGVRYLRFSAGAPPHRTIGMAWRATTARRELLGRMAEVLREHAPSAD
jgi:LysR family hydrogen peroxide-inducible transcriptional activator